MQSLQFASDDVCGPNDAKGSLVVDPSRLQKPRVETQTDALRRAYVGRRLTARVYAALHGCSLATAREILAGIRRSPRPNGVLRGRIDHEVAWLVDTIRQRIRHGDQSPTGIFGRARRTTSRQHGRRPGRPRKAEPWARDKKSSPFSSEYGSASALIVSIIEAASHAWRLEPAELCQQSRLRAIAAPRQAAMAIIAAACPSISLARIARLFGHNAHTTVMHACRAHSMRLQRDPVYAENFAKMIGRLEQEPSLSGLRAPDACHAAVH